MKKMLTLLLLVVAQTSVVLADDVSVEQALQTAREFAVVQTARQTNMRKAPKAFNPRLAYTVKSLQNNDTRDNVYVINLGNDQGFVVVSGESNTPDAVLGYCDHGSFCLADAPIQLKDLLDGYSRQIDQLRQNPSLANGPSRRNARQGSHGPRRINTSVDIGTVVVGPLLTTKWNQWAPYNNLCPVATGDYSSEYGVHAPSGCVPTAFAQILNYYQWPHESYGCLLDPATIQFTGEDISGHVYDWDNMVDDYSLGYNAAQAQAVAQLMADIGKSMGTQYNRPNGSPTGWTTYQIAYNFNYEEGQQTSTQNADALMDVMKQELDELRPIPYAGYPTDPDKDGHALVCDGYTTEDYFHFNYGWGGHYDGYYKPSVLPMFSPIAYVITGFRPAYNAKFVTIGDIEYGLNHNGEAHIIRYTRGGVSNMVLDIPSAITDEGKEYLVTNIRKHAFYNKGHFSKITLGDNIREIGRFAFIGSNIDTLVISDKIENIPDESFRLTNLKGLTIGASVKRIGKEAFAYCKLKKVVSKSPAFEVDDRAFFSVSEPDCGEWLGCITRLGTQAFCMTNFKQAPDFAQLEEIGSEAFASCSFPNSEMQLPPRLRAVSPDAFNSGVFYGFKPNASNPYFTATMMGLLYNNNQTSLVLSPLINMDIDDWMLPESLIKLEPNSIRSRKSYGSGMYFGIDLPGTLVEMEGAFSQCETLGKLKCRAVTPPVISDETFNDKIFENKPDIALYVPQGTADLYRTAPGWRKFSNIVDNLEYVPVSDAEREYYMVMHRRGEDQQTVSVPVSQVNDMKISGAGDTQKVVLRLNGRDDISTLINEVDSITWRPGFVYDSAEIFDLNDSTLTAKGQKCEVTFEPTAIDEDVQLCIRNMVFTPNVLESTIRGYAVDLSLSDDQHELSGTAEIVMPIALDSEEKIHAAYYNEETGEWERVMFRYDNDRQAVVITTDHLSLFSIFTTHNDNMNNAKVELLYAIWPDLYTLNEAAQVLLEIVSSDDPMERIKEFKDEMGLWQGILLDGGYSMLSSLGFGGDAIDNAVGMLGHFGTFLSIVDIMKSEMEGDDVGVAAGTLNLIMNQTVGTMASAIGTPIMSAAMGCVAFIGIALNKFGTMVQERKVDLFREATRLFYSKKGRRKYGTPYRSAKDWFNFFYPTFLEGGMTESQLNTYIEQSVRDYFSLFWSDQTGSSELCIEEAKAMGLSSMMYPDEATRKTIDNEHFAELMNGELVSVFRAIKNKLAVQADARCEKAVQRIANWLNTGVILHFTDSSCKEGETSKYNGWKVTFTEIPSSVGNPEIFTQPVNEKGRSALGFTVFALTQNKMKCQVTLKNPNDVEQKTFDFQIPDGTGRIYINIDLAEGGTVIEVPRLENLKLEYDPAQIETEYTWAGMETVNEYDMNGNLVGSTRVYHESPVGVYVLLDDGMKMNKNARFQKEVERFFKLHDYIRVDEMGNIFIGEDIIGKLDEGGKTATGTFTINTTNSFVEKTPEQFCTCFNKPGMADLVYQMYNLLGGTIDHSITCQYTLTRQNANSKEFDITYTGEGTYTFRAEIVDRVDNMNFDNYPGGSQTITVDDITTREVQTEGRVTLNYTTKLL